MLVQKIRNNLQKNLKQFIKLSQKKKLNMSLINLKKNGARNILLFFNLGEISGIIYLYILNILLILEKLSILPILLNQYIDNLENLLKQKVHFQMMKVYSNYFLWVSKMLRKSGLCLLEIGV